MLVGIQGTLALWRAQDWPFDRLRTGLGVVDVARWVEAEEAVLVEVESVGEDVQVPHAAGRS